MFHRTHCFRPFLENNSCCDIAQEEFEDTKREIRIRKAKKNRQRKGKQKDKRTNNDLQNITYKTKDQVARILL